MNTNLREAEGDATKAGAALLLVVGESWAYVMEAFLHRRFGHRYRDARAGWGLCLLLFFALCWDGHDLGPLIAFTGAYFVVNLAHRVSGAVRMARGEMGHSNYTGWPIFKWTVPVLSESQFKLWVEPAVVVIAGAVVSAANAPLGTFWILAGFILLMKNFDENIRQWRRAVAINDSMIESQITLERFRGQVGILN